MRVVAAALALLPLLTAPSSAETELRFACVSLSLPDGDGPFAAVVADLDGDGRLDIVTANSISDTVSVVLQRSPREFVAAGVWKVGRVPRGLAVVDVDGDGHLDVVVPHASSRDFIVLRGDGAGGLSAGAPQRAGWAPFHVLPADLDGDEHVDLAVVDESNWADAERRGTVTLLRGRGDATFERFAQLEAGIYPSYALWLDVDGDGREDLLVANWYSGDLSLFRRESAGSFAPRVDIAVPGLGPAYGLAAADLDGDGHADVVVTDVSGHLRLLRGDGRGGLQSWQALALRGSGTRDVAAADLDGDGFVDLVTADQHSETVSVVRGGAGGTFAAPVAIEVGPRPRSVTVADLDGDGRLDIVVANQGANTLSLLYQTRGDTVACRAPEGVPVGGPLTE